MYQTHEKCQMIQVWDTGGQQRYRPVLASCYRGALGVIIVFDVTNMVRVFVFVKLSALGVIYLYFCWGSSLYVFDVTNMVGQPMAMIL